MCLRCMTVTRECFEMSNGLINTNISKLFVQWECFRDSTNEADYKA